ncbi:MAG: class I tRNA ligase family protein, partial [Dehalococcoidia bacterium]
SCALPILGRPGWHIECTAMSSVLLGPTLDLHGGGSDLIYPHHECEIAQSESATGISPFVRTWVHVGMLEYQGEKMSKSLGNMVFAGDLLAAYPADAIRLALYTHHYREPWEYTEAAIKAGQNQFERLRAAMTTVGGSGTPLDHLPWLSRAWAALDDDLDLPRAVDEIVTFADIIYEEGAAGGDVSEAQRQLRTFSAILGLTLR